MDHTCNNANAPSGNAAQPFPPTAEAASTADSSQVVPAGRPENSVQVSTNNIPIFYARIGRRMLTGHGDGKPGFDEVIFTGLGMATKTAIGAASLLERENAARITRVETSYFQSTLASPKMVPKITIICTRTPEFVEQIAREKAVAAEGARVGAGEERAPVNAAGAGGVGLGASGVAGGLVADAIAAA